MSPLKPDTLRAAPACRRALVLPAILAVAFAAAPASAGIDDWLLFQGLGSAESFRTDDDSVLLSRNEGDTGGGADLLLWQAVQFAPSLHLFAMEQVATESGSDEGTETETELLLLRYVHRSKNPVAIEAGKILTPVGTFPDRRLADANPLIGAPAIYDTEYPLGIAVSGVAGRFDYLASVISLPLRDGRAMPEADDAPRPAVGLGYTPFTGFRVGAFYTRGAYLGPEVEDYLQGDDRWRDFDQDVAGLEVHLTRGYFVFNGEYDRSAHEIPTGETVRGYAWYAEGRYTLTPRLFTALRLEQSKYPFVRPVSPTFWIAAPVNLYDAEVGMGYRITPTTLLKVSYRRDLWDVDEAIKPYYPEGYAVSVQLSQKFDVLSWFNRRP